MRVQPGSAAEIRSSCMVGSSICCSPVFHSLHSISMRLRICGVRSASAFSRMSAMAALSFAGVCAITIPRSSRKALNWLMTAVRREISRSRTPWIAWRSSWSSVLIGTKRMFLRSTASAIASASTKSFLFDFTKGFTNWAAISRASWPCLRNARPRK